jgi:tRNA pseudouridine55 synthase
MTVVSPLFERPLREDLELWEGVWVLNKPEGYSSNQVLQKLRKKSGVQKMGHLGTLDPIATGVLPVCIGWATKIIPFIPDHPKGYRAVMALGIKTDTQDATGQIIGRWEGDLPNLEAVTEVLKGFRGEQVQTPPSYSALKYKGRPLYHWARKGIRVEKPPRVITIHSIEVLGYEGRKVTFEVFCSPGTYVRTLCNDVGDRLGCGAHLAALVRIQSGPFRLSQAVPLERLLEARGPEDLKGLKIPQEEILGHLPQIRLGRSWKEKIRQGRFLILEEEHPAWPQVDAGGPVCLRGPQNEIWAIYRKEAGTKAVYRPLRVII